TKMPDVLTIRWPAFVIPFHEAFRMREVQLTAEQGTLLRDCFNKNASVATWIDEQLLREVLRIASPEQLLHIRGMIPALWQVLLQQTDDGVRNKLLLIADPPTKQEIVNLELNSCRLQSLRRIVAEATAGTSARIAAIPFRNRRIGLN
ncbi:MAG: hypothetical protein ACJ8M1_05260, partial [Chthoniobacterales bacterium]